MGEGQFAIDVASEMRPPLWNDWRHFQTIPYGAVAVSRQLSRWPIEVLPIDFLFFEKIGPNVLDLFSKCFVFFHNAPARY